MQERVQHIPTPNAFLTGSMRGLAIVLRRYGFFGLDSENNGAPVTRRLRVVGPSLEAMTDATASSVPALTLIIAPDASAVRLAGLRAYQEPAGGFLYTPRRSWFARRPPAYRPLLAHVSFSGEGLTPVLATKDGRTVIGWWQHNGQRHLIVGLNVVEELVRYTHGDPTKVETARDKTLWGHGHERSAYLFEDHIVRGYELSPWADRLGFLLARLIAFTCGIPLVEPLPEGAKGGVVLTGDDDQAYLEKYDEQLRLLDGFPISYIMLPHTKHTSETLARMPKSVEFGIHVDALPNPAAYEQIAREQTNAVRRLTGHHARTVRNHGHLNRGYWGQLAAWEDCGLVFDLNTRGLDGTCPTGSYLPFRVRRADLTWSNHTSLFSTFSDSMLYLQKWPQRKQVAIITGLANQIERTDPGVIVVNLHPQNVSDHHDVHRAVMSIGRRPGWVALGTESYLDWLQIVDGIRMYETERGFELHSPRPVEKLALALPEQAPGQKSRVMDKWSGNILL